jgi:hypothetical protein
MREAIAIPARRAATMSQPSPMNKPELSRESDDLGLIMCQSRF